MRTNALHCACLDRYEGPSCDIDARAGDPYLNAGTCVDDVDGLSRVCAVGFTGETCAETDRTATTCDDTAPAPRIAATGRRAARPQRWPATTTTCAPRTHGSSRRSARWEIPSVVADCCETPAGGDAASCSNRACSECVCAVDSYCCGVGWDASCRDCAAGGPGTDNKCAAIDCTAECGCSQNTCV